MGGKSLLHHLGKIYLLKSRNFTLLSMRNVTTSPIAEIKPQLIPREVEEVNIPVPWGHIAGKWWGPKNKRPILMLHGWQDNCGTFNTLVPYLRSDIGYLAIDFPGHGYSSHFPQGTYSMHATDNLIVTRRVVEYFNWESVSFISHSLGAVTAYMYAAVYPDNVDFLVGFDSIKPITIPPQDLIKYLPRNIEDYFKCERNIASGSEPPSYTYDELIERLHNGTNKSIDKNKCQHILERNIKKSTKDLNKYYFSRDSRLKALISGPIDMQLSIEMAKMIKCRMLTIKAIGGSFFGEKLGYYEIVDLLKESNPKFQYVEIPGMHHVHLNDPEQVAPLVNDYLSKYAQHLIN